MSEEQLINLGNYLQVNLLEYNIFKQYSPINFELYLKVIKININEPLFFIKQQYSAPDGDLELVIGNWNNDEILGRIQM